MQKAHRLRSFESLKFWITEERLLTKVYFVFSKIFCLRLLFAVAVVDVGKIISFCADFGSWTKCFSCCPFPELISWYGELFALLLLFDEMILLVEVGVVGLKGILRELETLLLLLSGVLLKLFIFICGWVLNLTMVELLLSGGAIWALLVTDAGAWELALFWFVGIADVELRRRICAELILIAVGGLRLFALVMIGAFGL